MLIYGKQLFLYILEKYPEKIQEIMLSKEVDKKLFNQLIKLNKKIIKLDNKKAQALAKGGNHQGFFLEIEDIEFQNINEIKKSNFLLVLVGLTDVGNIGSIIRSAYALGVDGVVISENKNINLSAVARSSSGAIFDMPISLFPNTLDLINELKQLSFSTYVATMDGVDVKEVEFPKNKKVLFLGSEGEGVPKKVLNRVDTKVSIKMQRNFDSLNVNSAASILIDRMR